MFKTIYFQADRSDRIVAQGDDGEPRLARISGRWVSVEAMKAALLRRGLIEAGTKIVRC